MYLFVEKSKHKPSSDFTVSSSFLSGFQKFRVLTKTQRGTVLRKTKMKTGTNQTNTRRRDRHDSDDFHFR